MKTTTEQPKFDHAIVLAFMHDKLQESYERGRVDGSINTLDGLIEQLTSMRRNRLPMETVLNDLAAAKQQLLAIKLAKSAVMVPEKGKEPEELH